MSDTRLCGVAGAIVGTGGGAAVAGGTGLAGCPIVDRGRTNRNASDHRGPATAPPS